MFRSRVIILILIMLAALLLMGGALLGAYQASEASRQPDPDPPQLSEVIGMLAEPSNRSVVRLYFNDRQHLDQVAGQLDIWEVDPEEGYAVVALPPEQRHWLEVLGYRMQTDPEKTGLLQAPMAPLDPRFYYFDDEYPNPNGNYVVDFLTTTNNAYPELTELIDIGDAWLADQPGEHARDIWVLRVTNEDPAFGDIANKPVFFLFATIHAREVAVPELAIRYIKYLTEGYDGEGGYGLDPDATWLVDHNVVYVLVMQNPDGHWVNEGNADAWRRKNMDSDDGCSDPNYWGVDLNRNHSFLWDCCGGSSGYACDTTYRGPSAASEPETQAFQDYFATVVPDQNGPNGDDEIAPASPLTTTGIFISLHSYSDLVLWPWGFDNFGVSPNYDQLETIGRKFAYFNDYTPPVDGSIGYEVDGATDDWTYGKFGVASFTFEVGPGSGACGSFFPAYECIDGESGYPEDFWAENKPAFLYAHKIAKTPYMIAYGPDVGDLAAIPEIVSPGQTVQIFAVAQDHRYGDDPLGPIAGAEYFIDGPGEDGAGTPMVPVDGNWGEFSEEISAVLDTSALSIGQHYLLVHSKNSAGDWGPFSAVFLNVTEPGAAPVIEGYVKDINHEFPLEASLTAGEYQAFSDPLSGYYSMTVLSGTYDLIAVSSGYGMSVVTGLQAPAYETVQQDFYLAPICEVFSDDVEAGDIGWTAQHDWGITAEAAHSPYASWTDSPDTNYGNNWNYSLTSPEIDLSAYDNVAVSFWHIYDLESSWDFAIFEASADGGSTWTEVDVFNGPDHKSWTQQTYSLPQFDHLPTALLRFRLETDATVAYDGWYIDDVRLTASGIDCDPYTAPSAGFTSNSPIELGDPMVFTNQTQGTQPITYTWDFGDGAGTSTQSDPNYTYLNIGSYTVTLTASNIFGMSTITGSVAVIEPIFDLYMPLVSNLIPAGEVP